MSRESMFDLSNPFSTPKSNSYYRIMLVREGESPVELGTTPDDSALERWFSGAYGLGLLPDPPRYTDEIQILEVGIGAEPVLKWVWRIGWHQFEAAQERAQNTQQIEGSVQ